jgi:S-DNA-T family DNA segregation ATPase FtsK/SpoIIIE
VRANISVRIALRTAHGDESRDVLDDPVAAHLPRAHPGRAVMRVGSGAPVVLQSAHCGTEQSTMPPVTVGPLQPTAWDHPEPARGADPAVAASPLDAAVRVAAAAAGRRRQRRTHRPWLDPLPDHLALEDLAPEDLAPEDLAAEGTRSRDGSVADRPTAEREPHQAEPAHRADHPGVLVVGLIDRPELQRRDPLELDLAHSGGALVVGAGGSGRSTALHTMAVAAWRHADPWELYVIDAAPAHSVLAEVGSVGDVIDVADSERVLRLLRSTAQLVTDRARAGRADPRPGGPARRVLVVDGIAAFEQRYDRLDRGAAVELLTSILRDGRAVGVHVVVTAHRRAEVPAELLGLLGCRWVLRCASDDDASTWGLGPAAADRRLPPGRCHVEGALAQVAVADARGAAPRSRAAGAAPPPVPRLPTELWRSDLQLTDPTVSLRPAIGLHGDTLEPVHLVLDHHHAIVAGPPRSGVSTALATIAAGHPHPVVVRPGETAALEGRLTDALAAARQGHEQLVVVHDLVHLLEARDGEAVAAALEVVARAGRDAPVRLVVGGELDGLTRSYHDLVAILRRGRTGLLLGADPDQHATLWHTSAPPRSDLPPAPGRGWLIQAASVQPVQVAQP